MTFTFYTSSQYVENVAFSLGRFPVEGESPWQVPGLELALGDARLASAGLALGAAVGVSLCWGSPYARTCPWLTYVCT